MRKVSNFLKDKLLHALIIPSNIREDFLQESVHKNHTALLMVCAIIFGVECYNIFRVLFWSRSGLGTLNNRIYFSMYCTLLASSLLWLFLQKRLRSASFSVQLTCQYAMVLLILLWHILLNTYDLYRDPNAGVITLTTALLGLSFLIQLPPLHSLLCFGIGYLLFQILAFPLLSSGDEINLTIVFLVAMAVSLIHTHHAFVNLQQRQQITLINEKLKQMLELDPLTGLLNKVAQECRGELYLNHIEKTGGITLFLMDLDDFKAVNDRYGHPGGDYVLKETAAKLRSVFPTAEIGRIGGDEFAVLLDYPLTQSAAYKLAQQLMQALMDIYRQGEAMKIRCSLGVCTCTCPNITYKDLYELADHMLYLAKRSGKSRCCFHQVTSENPLTENASSLSSTIPSNPLSN